MKNIKISVASYMCLVALSTAMVSCSDSKREDPANIAEDHNDSKFDDKTKEQDAQFMVDAAAISLEEIQLGQLAQSKASAADVKDLATMMVDEHTKALAELKTLAAKKMVTLPESVSNDGLDAYNKLMEKSGTEFDKKYSEMMVDGHQKAIRKFESEANDEKADMDVKDWANKMLPSLRTHLDHSMTCSEKYK